MTPPARPTPIQVIRQWAPKYGLDPAAVLAYALTQGGTSWGAVGDQGSSFGPFQAHIGGVAGSRSPREASAWANSPQGLQQMMSIMSRAGAKGLKGPDAAAYIVGPAFGRGANPARDIANARAKYAPAQAMIDQANTNLKVSLGIEDGPAPALDVGRMQNNVQTLEAQDKANQMIDYLKGISEIHQRMQGALAGPIGGEGSTLNRISQMGAAGGPPTLTADVPAAGGTTPPQGQPPAALTPPGIPDLAPPGSPALPPQGGPPGVINHVLNVAESQIGKPYVWGGETPKEGGFDCSGLVDYAMRQAGINLPGRLTTWSAAKMGKAVDLKDIQPGDWIISNKGKHMSIYAGNGQVVVAPHTGAKVRYQPLSDFKGDITTIRRFNYKKIKGG